MRTSDGKENCLVLDFAGNVARHGPIDGITVPEEKGGSGKGEAPTKVCPSCEELVAISARECTCCGHEFPPSEAPKVERTASTEAIMNLTATEVWHPVTDVDYTRHRKPGSPDSLRVDYLIGGKVVSEWVCFGHAGYARQKAVSWWQQWAGTPPPNDVEDAQQRLAELRQPTEATLTRDGKYHRIGRLRRRLEEVVA
jgi:DNA repair protein RadD